MRGNDKQPAGGGLENYCMAGEHLHNANLFLNNDTEMVNFTVFSLFVLGVEEWSKMAFFYGTEYIIQIYSQYL
jgi:hypothetical protein